MLGRTVNEATSFRYLYEPQPATGQYWFSDNVWHDAKAELLWASDLNKLYNQDVVLNGLRTLTPYLTFAGDVRFAYLALGRGVDGCCAVDRVGRVVGAGRAVVAEDAAALSLSGSEAVA